MEEGYIVGLTAVMGALGSGSGKEDLDKTSWGINLIQITNIQLLVFVLFAWNMYLICFSICHLFDTPTLDFKYQTALL